MKISAYTKVYNCFDNKYPWKESIRSMMKLADQVVVVDSGSTDGTWEVLSDMASEKDSKILAVQHPVDQNAEDFAHRGDGLQKAKAREYCNGDVLFQFDCDEILAGQQVDKTKALCYAIFQDKKGGVVKETDVFIFPMIEFWGKDKFRVDIPFYKPRISFNTPAVTHDIPKECRKTKDNGVAYSTSSDGCDYVLSEDLSFIRPFCPFPLEQLNFMERARAQNIELYSNSLLKLVDGVGTIYHYSWYDIPRKIRTYRDYWSKHWNSLFNKSLEDTSDNNMFFGKPWSDVSEEEIEQLGAELEKEIGGWIFHSKIDFSTPSQWIDTKVFEEAGFDLERPHAE